MLIAVRTHTGRWQLAPCPPVWVPKVWYLIAKPTQGEEPPK